MTEPETPGGKGGGALLRWLLFLAGLFLLGWVIQRVGLRQVYQDLLAQSWAIVPFILLSGLENSLHTFSCQKCVSPAHRAALPWWRMFLLYHLAYAINTATPTGEVGGDVARGIAMRRHVPGTEAASAVLINKFTFSIARMAVAATLAGMALVAFPLDPTRAWMIGAGTFLTSLALVLFAVVQAKGLLGPVLSKMARIAGVKAQEWMKVHAAELDRRLRDIYAERRGDLVASIGFDMLGFVVGAIQRCLLVAVLLGSETFTPGRLLLVGGAVWGITNLVDMIFFFVMGRLGIREASYKVAFESVGLSGEKGVVVSVVDRIDQLFWTLLGFGVYWSYLLRSPSEKNGPALLAPRGSK
jgi:hypothetical protein